MSTSCSSITLLTTPHEVQVHILTYLRAFDLSALQQTCRFYNDPGLIHAVVVHTSEHVYSSELTKDVVKTANGQYTLEHLRHIELAVVAGVLSRPEPKSGFYISRSWVKKTLLWLETVNEPPRKKKLNKKQQRQRARRLSDVSPPWPNINSDIVCCHQNLQRCGAKAARSRRRLMDKKAWKILKRLYPDSTQLESVSGECLQCLLETETARKTEQDRLEQEKLERKKPLTNPHIRGFYTRTRGVPLHCVVDIDETTLASLAPFMDGGRPATGCPLVPGTYVILPRSWCHQFRHYMKSGEGGFPSPPDSSALLCDAHKYTLLPPHLEAYLNGETSQLLSAVRSTSASRNANAGSPACNTYSAVPVGVQPDLDPATVSALMAAGMSPTDLASQQMAMMQIHDQQTNETEETPRHDSNSQNDLLDRENHVVVELVTEDEWNALHEEWKQHSHFAVRVHVDIHGVYHFSTDLCRECDPTGSRFLASAEVKYRRKRWEPKNVEQRRVPDDREY